MRYRLCVRANCDASEPQYEMVGYNTVQIRLAVRVTRWCSTTVSSIAFVSAVDRIDIRYLIPVLSVVCVLLFFFFFFQAEDGIRDVAVTGVQTCALPIWSSSLRAPFNPRRNLDRMGG